MTRHDVVHSCQVGKRELVVYTLCGHRETIPGTPKRPSIIGEGPAWPNCVTGLEAARGDAMRRLRALEAAC